MVYEALFSICALLYLLISIKLDYWITISILGFQSETPSLFIRKPVYYESFRSALFLSAVAMLFIQASFPWYIGAGILAFFWLFSGKVGRKKAFVAYRNIIREMINYAETDEEESKYLGEVNKTDQDLMDEISNI